jgi:hypothetical protein
LSGRPLRSLRFDRPFGSRELALAFIGFIVVAALALGPFVRHGGFFLDDWSNGAGALQPPGSPDIGKALSFFAEITEFRPVLIVYVPLTYFVFGMHIHLQDAWSVFLAVLAGTTFYSILRTLGVPWLHCWLIAAWTIVFPWSDATRFWVTGDQVTLSITIMGLGLLVALVGLNRHSWRWHAGAVALYLVSILTYEIALPLIACLGVLYWLRAGWRAARFRWLADLGAVLIGGAWVGAHTKRTTSGFAGDFEHLKQIVTGGGTIVGRAGMPLGSSHTGTVLVVLGLAICVGLGAYLYRRDRFDSERGWGLRGWLFLAGGGLVVTLLSWVMYIPADPYYTPSVYGLTNRVNGLAAFGLALLVYGAFGIVGTLIGQLRQKTVWLAPTVTVLLAIAMLGSYTHVLRRHIAVWNEAFGAQIAALTELKATLPRLPSGATVFAGSYPANQTLGVPIFASTWDFDGMVKIEYDDFSLSGYPILEGLHVVCTRRGVALAGEGASEAVAPYGLARLVDFQTGAHTNPPNRRVCERVAGQYVPGPLYLSFAY